MYVYTYQLDVSPSSGFSWNEWWIGLWFGALNTSVVSCWKLLQYFDNISISLRVLKKWRYCSGFYCCCLLYYIYHSCYTCDLMRFLFGFSFFKSANRTVLYYMFSWSWDKQGAGFYSIKNISYVFNFFFFFIIQSNFVYIFLL